MCVAINKPQLLTEYDITQDDFSSNMWRVFYEVVKGVAIDEGKQVLDVPTVKFYLDKHPKLNDRFIEYNGFNTLENAKNYVNLDNFDGYVKDLRKYTVIYNLVKKMNIVVTDKMLSKFNDMKSDDIYEEYLAVLTDCFIKADSEIKAYDISDGIYDLIDRLDAGDAVGLPYHNMPMLTNETGGQYMGPLTLVGGISNVGKSAFLRNSTLPSIIEKNERIVIMLNEDGLDKWQREFIVYVANNIIQEDIQKQEVRDGNYKENTKNLLIRAADWIVEHTKNHMITIVPFKKYRTKNVIKTINKYWGLGVRYFALDTYKLDAGSVTAQSWLEMQQNMVEINDVVKPEAKNIHILITFQLTKGSTMQRYYTQDNIGMAKNIVDPASTCIMIRTVFDDEKEGGKRELKVYQRAGLNKRSEVPVKLEQKKHYQLVFIVKNREGSANEYQIVIEHDLSRNLLQEIGYTKVPMDI